MKNIILHILCEGQTEERFVKKILSPYLNPLGIYPKPVLLLTSKKQNAHGGLISFAKAKQDMEILFRTKNDNDVECNIFTTMFDYYALPNDFPGYEEAHRIMDVRERIKFIEKEFQEVWNNAKFIPYIQLHEFEALLFTDILKLAEEYPNSRTQINKLNEQVSKVFKDPELIDNGPDTAPSKRIKKAVSGHYEYNKVKSGTSVAQRIGIEIILQTCQHFREWVEKIRSLSCYSG